MLSFDHVSKSYDRGQTFAVQDVDLSIERGELLVIVGSSGSGKSTLLRMANGLVQPSAGTVRLDGRALESSNIIEVRRSIGYVIQSGGLFPHWPVWENITAVPKLQGSPRRERRALAEKLLSLVNLDPRTYLHRFPGELSGGEAQRVGVARALACRPRLLLMDEPFGALDAVTREQLQEEVRRLNKETGQTILLVTHDIFEALALADRIAVMHDGRLLQTGSSEEILQHPEPGFVCSLFEKPARLLMGFSEQD